MTSLRAPIFSGDQKKWKCYHKREKTLKKKWYKDLSKANFDLTYWYRDHEHKTFKNNQELHVLVELMKKKIDKQADEINELKRKSTTEDKEKRKRHKK